MRNIGASGIAGGGEAGTAPGSAPCEVAIIGAGFAGIGAAIRLRKAGIESFAIFERADDIGGTWRDNRYPGAACDVPSHAYSLSFEQNPNWSRRYAPAAEIHAYLAGLVKKWKLEEKLRLGVTIQGADYDIATGCWTLDAGEAGLHRARVVLSCMGGLTEPAWPDIPGRTDFAGELLHTARWPAEFNPAGKRVGIIGTGASAVQTAPGIVDRVQSLHVFQRTASWVAPRMDRAYPPRLKRLFARFPVLLRASRLLKQLLSELRGPMIFLDSPRLSRAGQRLSIRHLRAQVPDPELRRRLLPDYQFGCKRILISDDYWPIFTRDNVHLVTNAIERIEAGGVRSKDGTLHELDALIFATGFDVSLDSTPFPVRGIGGRTLDEAWQGGAVAYRGMSVTGFPNWFIMMGPNTGPGHTSVLIYTEAQISHVLHALRNMRRRGWKSVEVRPEVMQRYNARIQGRMKYMVWGTGCHSWYLSDDGSNHTLYPGFATEYALGTRRFRRADYRVETFDGAQPQQAPAATSEANAAAVQQPGAPAAAGRG